MTNLLLGLDTLNIVSLNAEVVEAGTITGDKIAADTITANEIAANAITTDEINAGAVTADKITVTELSAITANLGHITAGLIESIEIYGSYIATANGTYPRIELSSTGNLLQAMASATDYIAITPSLTGHPSFLFTDGANSGVMGYVTGTLFFGVATGNIQLYSNADVNLIAGGNLKAQSTNGTITDIVAAINSKENASTGFSGSFSFVQSVNFMAQTTTDVTAIVSNGKIVALV